MITCNVTSQSFPCLRISSICENPWINRSYCLKTRVSSSLSIDMIESWWILSGWIFDSDFMDIGSFCSSKQLANSVGNFLLPLGPNDSMPGLSDQPPKIEGGYCRCRYAMKSKESVEKLKRTNGRARPVIEVSSGIQGWNWTNDDVLKRWIITKHCHYNEVS